MEWGEIGEGQGVGAPSAARSGDPVIARDREIGGAGIVTLCRCSQPMRIGIFAVDVDSIEVGQKWASSEGKWKQRNSDPKKQEKGTLTAF